MNFTVKIRDYITYQEELYNVELEDKYLIPIFNAMEYLKSSGEDITIIDYLEIDNLLHRTTKFNRINHEAEYISVKESRKNVLIALVQILEDKGFSVILDQHYMKIINLHDYVLHK